jgi:hypothetical protein
VHKMFFQRIIYQPLSFPLHIWVDFQQFPK